MTMDKTGSTPRSFQEIILRLQAYWAGKGCAVMQPYDMEVGDRKSTRLNSSHAR